MMKYAALLLALLAVVSIGAMGVNLIAPSLTASVAAPVYRPLLQAATALAPTAQSQSNLTVYVAEPNIGSLQAQGFLLTASYIVTSSVAVEREAVWGIWNGERVNLDTTSSVYAGVDFSRASYDSATRTLTLPASQLGPIDADEAATNLTQSGSLMGPNQNDGSLQKQARLEAKARIIEKACSAGLLQQAATIAQQRVQASLAQVGIQNVTVVAKAGVCRG